MKTIDLPHFSIGEGSSLAFFLGPCVIESEEHTLYMAQKIQELSEDLGVTVIFKASFDKANRSSIDSFRGPGIEKGLDILQKVKEQTGLSVCSDIHLPQHAHLAKEVLDVLQIPAFLCRQTDLIVAAAKTGKPVSIKKGQFVAPKDMQNVVHKMQSCNNEKIILTERGTCFGYNNLVSDMRCIPIMKSFGYPVCFDATHSIQLPGGGKNSSGERQFIKPLSCAAVAAGCDMVFMECHNNPQKALSDKMSVIDLKELVPLIITLKTIHEVQKPICVL